MDIRKILLLVGALLVAGVTAVFARALTANAGAPRAEAAVVAPAPPQAEVLVATRNLPLGTIIDTSALKFRPWPKDMVTGAYYVRGDVDIAKLQGNVLRSAVTAGQPLTQGAVVSPGDRGFLAAALTPGMRAVTVPVSAQTAVAGFVFPGDRIDIVLTQDVAGGGDGPPLKASETILRNVRVLATDQRTDPQAAGDGKTPVQAFTTVTLEATPRIAEELAVAQTVGTLSLSLRALAENGEDMSRPSADRASYVTGGDISRYQRRTVPGRPATGGPASFTSGNPGATMAGQPMMPGAPGQTGPNQSPVVRVARGKAISDTAVEDRN